MAVNRYDRAAEAPIMNTYVPINFGELYRIGQAQKQAVDEAANQFNAQLQKFGEFRSPSAVDTQRYYDLTTGRQDVQNAINQIVSNPDALKDARFRANLQSVINNTDYATLSQLKEGADNLRKRNEITAELKAKGKWKDSWDVYFNNDGSMSKFDATSWDTLNQGVLDQLSPVSYTSLFDIVNPYVKDIKPSFIEGNVNPITGQKLSYTKGYNAITEKDLNNILERSVNEIISTPQGRLWYQDIKNAVTTANPNATNQDIYNAFMDNMMRDASYKLIATPVFDEFAMQRDLLNYKERLRAGIGSGKQQQQNQLLSIEDMMSKYSSDKFNAAVQLSRSENSPYNQVYQNINTQINDLVNGAMQSNPRFKQMFDTAVNALSRAYPTADNNALTQNALEYVLQNMGDKEGVKDLRKRYADLVQAAQSASLDETDYAVGKVMQQTINQVMQVQDLNANPFASTDVTLSGGEYYYDGSLFHDAMDKAVYSISNPLDGLPQQHYNEVLFGSQKQIDPEIGYSFDPRKLISSKQYLSTNKYMSELAKEQNYDITSTHLGKDQWWSTKNFDLEDLTAKGQFGNVAIGNVIGTIDQGNERNFVVEVNVPMKSINDHYGKSNALWLTKAEDTIKDYGLRVTPGSGEDSDGKWKDGYVTLQMIYPMNNDDLQKKLSNRLEQKNYGTTDTRESIINQDDILLQMKGFQPGYAIK